MLIPVPDTIEDHITTRELMTDNGIIIDEDAAEEKRVLDLTHRGVSPSWVWPLDGGIAFCFHTVEQQENFEEDVIESPDMDFQKGRFKRVTIVGTDIHCVVLRP